MRAPIPEAADAEARARDFLLGLQDTDGAWRDFDLPPGRAEAWATAFVGLSLARAGGRPGPRTRGALDRASAYLHGARVPGGGWGYNRDCPADADSTALACLFLAAVGEKAEPRDLAALARFQLANGGFATYRFGEPAHGWSHGHPEVTVTALRALVPHLDPGHSRIRAGLTWLQHARGRQELTSYWWPTSWYLRLELKRLALAAPKLLIPPERLESSEEPMTCFDLALCAELDLISSPTCRGSDSLVRLLARQSDDGGWPSEPILRVTDPRAFVGHQAEATASLLFNDQRRTFVTAAGLSAVSLFMRLADPRQ